MGHGYHWRLDFVAPLNLIICHNWYVLVIKHLSKWIELVPFHEKIMKMLLMHFWFKFRIDLMRQQKCS